MPVKGKSTGSGKVNPGPASVKNPSPRRMKTNFKENLSTRKSQDHPAKHQKRCKILKGTSKPIGPDGSCGKGPALEMSNESNMRARGCRRTGNPGSGK